MFKQFAAFAALCVSFLSSTVQAQNVFVLPGSSSTSTTVLPYTDQFVAVGTGFQAGSGAFQVFAKPDGTGYYVISASATQTVTAVDAAFTTPTSLGDLAAPATAAAMTPDGGELLVVAGGLLYLFDTATNTQINSTGIAFDGGSILDLAVSLDSSQAYVLTSTSNTQGTVATLYSIDPTSGTAINSLAITNIVTSVAVGPNDLVYVGGVNRFYEIDPTALVETTGGELAVNAKIGKPAFTPDGRYALLPNLTPGSSGASILLVDLKAHTVATSGTNLGTSLIGSIVVPGNSVAFAYAPVTQSLFQVSIPNLNVSTLSTSGVATLNTSALAVSNELAEGTNATPTPASGAFTTAHYLYLVASSTLYRIDLTSNQLAGSFSIPNPAQNISVTGPIVSGVAPSAILSYGTAQTIAVGGTSLPLVVRALDQSGNPIAGAAISFASTTTGAGINNPDATTGANGVAVTTVTGPDAGGPVIVTATSGSLTSTFAIQFGTPSGGGGGGTPTDTLSIVAGQGQLFSAGFGTSSGNGQPFTVKVTDANGNPVSGVSVTFEPVAASGQALGSVGTLSSASIGSDGGATKDGVGRVIITDDKGEAAVNFQPSAVVTTGFVQTSIQVSAPNTVAVTFYASVTTAEPGPTVFSAPSPGTTLTGQSGSTLTAAVKLFIATNQGTNIPNVNIQAVVPPTGPPNSGPFTTPPPPVPSPYVTCANPTGLGVLSDSTGTATCNLVIIGGPGNYQFSINVGLLETIGPFNITVTPGAPATVKVISGDKQSGAPGQDLAASFVVEVDSATGSPLPGQTVSFQPQTTGSITLKNVSATTDSNGRASAGGTLGPTGGTYQLKVIAGGTASGPAATFTFTVAIPASAINVGASGGGGGQTATVSTAFTNPVVFQVVDSTGTGIPGAAVTFTASNGATLGSATATTDASGNASTTVTAGATAGPITITATTGALSATITLTAVPVGPSNLVFSNGASFQPGIAPGAIATITGTGLLPGFSGVYTPGTVTGPLPTSVTTGALSGLSVTFNGVAAPIFSAASQNGLEQVTVQVPYEVTPGTASVVFNAPGGASVTVPSVPVQTVSPGLFETQYSGQNFAVAIRQSDGTYISPTNPANPGDTVCVFATGMGQSVPALATNSAGTAGATLVYPIDLGLNNAGVPVVSAYPLTSSVGVYILCMAVPLDVQAGPRQPVGLIVHTTPGNTSGDVYAQGSYIPIQ